MKGTSFLLVIMIRCQEIDYNIFFSAAFNGYRHRFLRDSDAQQQQQQQQSFIISTTTTTTTTRIQFNRF
jgi:hypothetical protein